MPPLGPGAAPLERLLADLPASAGAGAMTAAAPRPPLVAPHVHEAADAHHEAFQRATPFGHCVIDDFFEASFANELLAEFPDVARGNNLNEDGAAGAKSTYERIMELGGSYRALDACIRSPAFLALVGRITGVPDLLYDPHYFGGGTHENRHGQSLDTHIDFNYHPVTGTHRRLNLIVYLNPEWQDEWGGALELHRDPHDPAHDEVVRIAPVFNRCVVFETTEHSWHGFGRIALPEALRDTGRKSVALYFYTRDRPAAQTAAAHSTVYVDRPLPGHIRPGRTLTERDHAELEELLARRDGHIRRLYREVSVLQSRLDTIRHHPLVRLARRARRMFGGGRVP